jgi:ribosomal protein S18 acetylase RimI-like enzyme
MNCQLTDFTSADAEAVNRVALSAFRQYQHDYQDWAAFSDRIGNMAALAASGEIVVARVDGQLAGAVAYVGPGKEKAPFFDAEWPILRMLVVEPRFRTRGIGSALTEECVRRAVRDRAPLIALHTSRIMKVALSMYERMGFKLEREAPAICGVPYGVYVLELEEERLNKAMKPTR